MGKLIGIARSTRVRETLEELDAVGITKEKGLDGDRRGQIAGRQVTVLSKESWTAACSDLDVDLPWTTRRANLLVEATDLPQQVGAEFTIGPVTLRVMEETAPCSIMEKAHAGLRAALTPDWRGGVSCDVVQGGHVSIGDKVEV